MRRRVAPSLLLGVLVLVGLGLVVGGHVEHALLDLGIAGDLCELPLGGHLAKEIFAIQPSNSSQVALSALVLTALEATQWEQREYWLRLALLWGASAHERRKNAASTPSTTQPTSA